LVFQLKHDKDAAGRIWSADQLADDSSRSQSAPLVDALNNDSFWAVRAECAKLLAQFKTGDVEKALINSLKDKDARVAEAAAKSLGNFKSGEVANALKEEFNGTKNYFVRAAAALSLASADSSNAIPIAEKALKTDSFRQVIRSAGLDALVKLDSAKAFDAAVKLAEYGQPDAIRLKALTILIRDPYKKDEAVNLLEEYTKDKYWIAQLIAINGLGSLGNKDDIALLKEMEKNQSNFRIKEVAARSIKRIEAREKQKKS
jgi:aminopeptidase N